MSNTTDPTGPDEREALERLVYENSGNVVMPHLDRGLMSRQVAKALLAAGYSRTPRPVTVSEEAIEAALEAWDGRAMQDIEASPREHVTALLTAALPHLSSGQSEADIRAEAIKTWANLVRSELEATRVHGIELGEAYLEGMHSALRQAGDHAARLLNDAPPGTDVIHLSDPEHGPSYCGEPVTLIEAEGDTRPICQACHRGVTRRLRRMVDEYRNQAVDLRGVVERVREVVASEHHADTCGIALSPDAGNPCSCWKAELLALLRDTPTTERSTT